MSLQLKLQSVAVALLLELDGITFYRHVEEWRGSYPVNEEGVPVMEGAYLYQYCDWCVCIYVCIPRRLIRERRWSSLQLNSSSLSITSSNTSAIS